jgi:hypothetical protein
MSKAMERHSLNAFWNNRRMTLQVARPGRPTGNHVVWRPWRGARRGGCLPIGSHGVVQAAVGQARIREEPDDSQPSPAPATRYQPPACPAAEGYGSGRAVPSSTNREAVTIAPDGSVPVSAAPAEGAARRFSASPPAQTLT